MKSELPKVLITGASGLLGHPLCEYLAKTHQVTGLCLNHPIEVPGINEVRIKLTNADDVQDVFERVRPDLVIHAAGLTSVDQCEAEPELANLLNVQITRTITDLSRLYKSKLVHISTDHLWDGSKSLIAEDEPLNPINVYAKTKAEAEKVALENAGALVLRTNFFGFGRSWRPSFSDWIISRLQEGLPIHLFDDVFFSPIGIPSLLQIMHSLYLKDATGIYHLFGRERISKYEFGVRLARRLGFRTDRIVCGSVKDHVFKAPRPMDMSMSVMKLEHDWGIIAPSLEESFDRLWSPRPIEARL